MKIANEPAAAFGIVGAVIALLVSYGVLDASRASLWSAFLVAIVPLAQGWITRRYVMPVEKIKDAGISPESITQRAEVANGSS